MGRPYLQVGLVLLTVVGVAVFGRLARITREGQQPTEIALDTIPRAAASPITGRMILEQHESLQGTASQIDRETEAIPLRLATKKQTGAAAAGVGPLKIRYISLIAERHSGSTWMVQLLQDYFRHEDVTVSATLCTWKHWFQDRIYKDIQDGKRHCREEQKCPACMDINHTLVIAMWRNPYDWISGMHKIPWHAEAHANVQDCSKFMTMPWTMNPEQEALAREEALTRAKDRLPCIDNFLPWEVLPCRPHHEPAIYELDPSGEVYGNVYELRKAKIRDFNAVKLWAPYYEKILYEDMLVNDGLRKWLMSLETLYGLSGNYNGVPDASLAKKMETSRSHMYYLNSANCVPHCKMGGAEGKSARETLHRLWDEELEEDIGYHQVQ